jgi:hypothetical protein
LVKYRWQISASLRQTTMLCHSVRSCRVPLLSVHDSLVAMLKLQTGSPLGVCFNSGSRPRLPMSIALFTDDI